MLYSGISWDKAGFEVEVVDAAGATVRPATRFPARRAGEIAAHLRGFGQPVATVVDSTNGLLDGGLTAAGIEVYRADPPVLPARPPFGSVPAGELARAAHRDLTRLTRLDLADGTLGGRGDDLNAGAAASADTVATLTAAGRCLTHGPRDRPDVALTFDDGPLPPYTGQVLDILDRYGVRATFFCVGLLADAYPEIVAEIRRRGHHLGNHTWSHPFLPELSRAEVVEQVERTGEALAAATGEPPPTLFRPPYGGRSPQVLTGLAELGLTTVLWDALGWDWALPGQEHIARSVLDGTGPGGVILLHDGGGDRRQTVAALPAVLEGLLARDLRFVTVDEMLATTFPREAR
ncbi:polysaccharide deacetylase [Micromonospora rosaria]|uniref:Polysaccharide deacetylase n=1 Tax=Micromonospora rosaria TaxID=47874 RepID=A0A136PXL2_9ACTN|nr:polysaccharide deacetylase family protein [Micromonospora rosaria]KXK63113.1 polysaccharide deacetylase [Micromonospora rosaria]